MKLFVLLMLVSTQILSAQESERLAIHRDIERELFPTSIPSFSFSQPPIVQDIVQQTAPYEKKSVTTAVLYSLLLPGMGELYAGNYSMGKYFTIAEGALWLALIGFDRYGSWLENDAHNFAAQHAHFSLDGKSDQYFIDIGNFQNTVTFNDQARRDHDIYKLYNEDIASSDYWQWESQSDRDFYRDRRVSSNEMFNNTRFVAAAIGVNHLISALNAARITFSHNKNAEHAELLQIRARVIGSVASPDGIMISFSKNF